MHDALEGRSRPASRRPPVSRVHTSIPRIQGFSATMRQPSLQAAFFSSKVYKGLPDGGPVDSCQRL